MRHRPARLGTKKFFTIDPLPPPPEFAVDREIPDYWAYAATMPSNQDLASDSELNRLVGSMVVRRRTPSDRDEPSPPSL
jgi:hypothetical protein